LLTMYACSMITLPAQPERAVGKRAHTTLYVDRRGRAQAWLRLRSESDARADITALIESLLRYYADNDIELRSVTTQQRVNSANNLLALKKPVAVVGLNVQATSALARARRAASIPNTS